MKKKNIIAVPPFYEGTSFRDIVEGMKRAIQEIDCPIEIIGDTFPIKNRLHGELLDDKSYIDGQLSLLKILIEEGTALKILFLDFFNPGMDILKYYHEQQGVKCRYGSLLHGGSFLDDDLYSFDWIKPFESGWFGVYDKIYAPSRQLADAVPDNFREKMRIFPWGSDGIDNYGKEETRSIDVIFPHRLNEDKGIEELIDIASKMNDLVFAVTAPQDEATLKNNKYYKRLSGCSNIRFILGQSEQEHIKTLSSAKIVLSCAKQENFGYGIMKAVLRGCMPVLPNRLCYPEFFDSNFLYGDLEEARDKIRSFIKDPGDVEKTLSIARDNIKEFSFADILEDFFTD